jgi:hypothetical protein
VYGDDHFVVVFGRGRFILAHGVVHFGAICRAGTSHLAVRSDVLGQVVAAHELLVAFGALESLLSGVSPSVPL